MHYGHICPGFIHRQLKMHSVLFMLFPYKKTYFQEYHSCIHEESEPVESDSCDFALKEDEGLSQTTIKILGLFLLKLVCIFNVSTSWINELIEELNFLTSTASSSVIKNIILSTLRKHGYNFSVISELVKDLSQLNLFCAALGI